MVNIDTDADTVIKPSAVGPVTKAQRDVVKLITSTVTMAPMSVQLKVLSTNATAGKRETKESLR
jgi:hypothetical protein